MSLLPGPSRAPYPGLRPFRTDESDIFFGREHQTDELLEKLQRHRFIAITGPSGCGKSSLIRAGMIPALHAGFMAEAGAHWRVVQMRPGEQPMKALATALSVPEVLGEEQSQADSAGYIEAALRFGPLGLVEVINESSVFRRANLFLLIDQFEEIFRFHDRMDRDEADAFVRLLLETTARPGVPAFVVITMRSDYLGDCAVFHGLPEAINQSQYLTPRLTREECGSAIVGPARVFRGEVEPALVNRLLNDFGPDPDRLPLLQHALMRMWQRTLPLSSLPTPRFTLTLADYAAVGGLVEALSKHADEAFAELSPEQRRIAEVLFRRLTERGRGRRDTRAPARLGEVADATQVDAAEVARVVEVFRGEGRNFITPAEGPLRRDTLLDIGHESLIRQWGALAVWVEAEAESAATYLRLVDSAQRHKKGAAALLWGPDLQLTLAWEARERPTGEWAKRYGSELDYQEAFAFLRASQHEWEEVQSRKAKRAEEEQQREFTRIRMEADRDRLDAEAKAAKAEAELAHAQIVADRRLRRNRRLAGSVALLLLAVVVLGSWILYHNYMTAQTDEIYASWVKVNGIPRGIGKLTKEQAGRRAVSYVITRKGHQKDAPVVRMKAIDASGRPTVSHTVGTYLGQAPDTMPASRTPVKWEFIYDQDGRIAYEVAFDKHKRQVWSFVYSPADRGSRIRTAQFFGPDGFPLPRTTSCASSVTIEYSPEGHERLLRYRDRFGNPVPGPENAIVQEHRYDRGGNQLELISLDGNGKWMNDRFGNASLKSSDFDRFGNARRHDALDRNGAPTLVTEGWASRLFTFDESGNILETKYLDVEGRPTAIKDGWHKSVYRYGDRGEVLSVSFWATDGSPAVEQSFCHEIRGTLDQRGRLIGGTCIGRDGKPSPGLIGTPVWRVEYDEDDNPRAFSFFDAEGRPSIARGGWHRSERTFDERGNVLSNRFLDVERKPTRDASGPAGLRLEYKADREVRRQFFGLDGKPMVGATGYAEVQNSYDEDGNLTRVQYLGPDGRTPAVLKTGQSGMTYTHDACGREIERWFAGPNGKRVTTQDGYAGIRFSYDPVLGRAVGVEYLDVEGRLTVSVESIAGYTSTLDKFGNVTERRYFGLDRKPASHSDGSAGWRAAYDSRGHQTIHEYIDAEGRPIVGGTSGNTRYARRTMLNDSLGKKIEEAVFGPAGEPIYVDDGYARARYVVDENGRAVEQAFFDAAGKPTMTQRGCYQLSWKRDQRGHQIEERCLGLDGRPKNDTFGVHRSAWSRDGHGRLIGERHFATDDLPVLGPEGWHYRLTERDELGRAIRQAVFDRNDAKTTFGKDGRHLRINKYDVAGNVVEEKYLDTRGRLVSGDAGSYATVLHRYDRLGQEVQLEYRDDKGRLTSGPNGYARAVRAYDHRGRLVQESFWAASEAPIEARDGFARRQLEYGERRQTESFFRASGEAGVKDKKYALRITTFSVQGEEIDKTWWDVNRRPVAGDGWWSREATDYDALRRVIGLRRYEPSPEAGHTAKPVLVIARRYDERGRLVELTLLDAERKLRTWEDEHARVRYRNDSQGHVVEERYFGPDDRLVNRRDGTARISRQVDERGRAVEERYFDKDDRPVGRDGNLAHVVRYSYDERGNRISERYFTASAKPVAVASEAGLCAGRLWRYDAIGRRESEEGICLNEQGQPAQR